jgi:hypothetical protein
MAGKRQETKGGLGRLSRRLLYGLSAGGFVSLGGCTITPYQQRSMGRAIPMKFSALP